MKTISRRSLSLLLVLLTVSTSNAWTARNPLSFRGLTVQRTPRFIHVRGTESSSNRRLSLPFHSTKKTSIAPPQRKRWLRSLVSIAGLVLITTLLSPTTAFASTPPEVKLLPKPVPTLVELQLTIRLLFASILGACVGKERSSTHKHSAGVRTMALVALGACAFTVCSSFGFAAGKCDPSRMASNVASGVGFVGAGVITTTSANPNDSRQSIVHGLTTATAIWISAAIGVACGVGMLYIASAATLLTISILRFGGLKIKLQTATKSVEEKLHHGLFPTRTPKQLPVDIPLIPLASNSTTSTMESTTAALEELNQDDEWDSHVEIVIAQDDPECQSEQIVSHQDNKDPTVALPKEEMQRLRQILNIDQDITEFYIRGQASILEQAHNVARSKNLTGLVTSNPQNSTFAAVTEEYTRLGSDNSTWAP